MKLKLDNKKIIICGGVVILAIILILALVLSIKNNVKNRINRYETTMKELATTFYEEHYYNIITNTFTSDYLELYKDNGLEVDLDTLANTTFESKEKAKKLVNIKTKESCDRSNTKVIIKTKEPYGIKDYSIEIKLDCGFDN